jgi:hypothetical protein
MPSRVRFRATFLRVGGDYHSEMVHLTPNPLIKDCHVAFCQPILDVTQAEGEPEVEPYRLLIDLGPESIAAVPDLVHPRRATRPPKTSEAGSRDPNFQQRPLAARGRGDDDIERRVASREGFRPRLVPRAVSILAPFIRVAPRSLYCLPAATRRRKTVILQAAQGIG